MGFSPLHASSVGLVRNVRTNNISPQFHLVFDDFYETVHSVANETPHIWEELVIFNRHKANFDEEGFVPELAEEWQNPVDH